MLVFWKEISLPINYWVLNQTPQFVISCSSFLSCFCRSVLRFCWNRDRVLCVTYQYPTSWVCYKIRQYFWFETLSFSFWVFWTFVEFWGVHRGKLCALEISLFPVSSLWNLLFTVVCLVALIFSLSGFVAKNNSFQNYEPLLVVSNLSFIVFWIRLDYSWYVPQVPFLHSVVQ